MSDGSRPVQPEIAYRDYLAGISFRVWQPGAPPWLYDTARRVFRKFDRNLEILNTRLPGDARDMRDRLEDLCRIPRMSTYAVGAIINAGVARMNPAHCFVNVGVWHGFTLLSGMMKNPDKRCIGVDNFSEFGGPREKFQGAFRHYKSENHFFYDMDYVEYFAKVHREPIGVYIYDGEHSYENQVKGLRIAEPFFADDCVILVDDTNLKAPRWALEEFLSGSKSRYEILLDRRTYGNLHPTFWNGLIVLQKRGMD